SAPTNPHGQDRDRSQRRRQLYEAGVAVSSAPSGAIVSRRTLECAAAPHPALLGASGVHRRADLVNSRDVRRVDGGLSEAGADQRTIDEHIAGIDVGKYAP